MQCRSSAMAMDASMAVRPAVKFRFTGTLSASSVPRFASSPALPGGSTMAVR